MSVQAELPRWQCHKVVHAAKIAMVARLADGGFKLALEGGYEVEVSHSYVGRAPTGINGGGAPALVGGYYVVYEDGYRSWSPAETFEQGYSRLP